MRAVCPRNGRATSKHRTASQLTTVRKQPMRPSRLPRTVRDGARHRLQLAVTAAPSLPLPEQLSGVAERVTFHNADSGLCVLRLRHGQRHRPGLRQPACGWARGWPRSQLRYRSASNCGGCRRSVSTSIRTLASSRALHSGAGICMMASGVLASAIHAPISPCCSREISRRRNIPSSVFTRRLQAVIEQHGQTPSRGGESLCQRGAPARRHFGIQPLGGRVETIRGHQPARLFGPGAGCESGVGQHLRGQRRRRPGTQATEMQMVKGLPCGHPSQSRPRAFITQW